MNNNPEGGFDDSSRPDTPLASMQVQPVQPAQPVLPIISKDPLPVPLHAPPSSDSNSSQFLLPIPIPPTNRSQSSFTLSDVLADTAGVEPLTPEIASADVSIAPDGTFVETSVGPAARELKKLYDQRLGVGMTVRSPYAITAFVNQHGKEMYRIGHRDLSAPAASALKVEELSSQSKAPSAWDDPQATHSKRRSRLSMHALLPPSMFKNGSTPASSATRPLTSTGPHRKLRKTRSIPDMFGFPTASSYGPGRVHSHSVTGADMSRFPTAASEAFPTSVRLGDIFGEVMNWGAPPHLSTQSLISPSDGSILPTIILNPFGPGVTFDSPSAGPLSELLPSPPHVLREMQSFESGLTARQVDLEESSPQKEKTSDPQRLTSRIPSVSMSKKLPALPIDEDISFAPLPETSMLSRYSTDVFDVLQTYRGLPLLDKISPDSAETTVIKMSLANDDTAAPRDDPRFVIWGEFLTDHEVDDVSISQGSFTDLSSSTHSSSASRKRGTKGPPVDLPSLRLSPGQELKKVIVAATIERWIAQLTSDLNYDELLDFFLTYRTYITAIDLCHLLICRFHWALAQHASARDEMVRRIVRVRTFVAIRYWLLTFFVVDFLPNRELRLLVADWLNTLFKDPVLEMHNDGLSIVRKLKKVVKDCKKAHMPSPNKVTSKRHTSTKPPKTTHVLGEKFAEAIATQKPADDDSDVDLDFLPDEVAESSAIPSGYPSDPANAHLSAAHVGAGLTPATPISMAALAVLQHTPRPTDSDLPPVSLPLTSHQNPISRAFVNTIGRLGRWKRVLNARSAARPLAPCAGVSAFDLDLSSVAGDLPSVSDELPEIEQLVPSTAPAMSVDSDRVAVPANIPPPPSVAITEPAPAYTPAIPVLVLSADDHVPENPDVKLAKELPVEVSTEVAAAAAAVEKASIRTSSTDSLGKPLSPGSRMLSILAPPEPSPWQFDIVSIDDLDFSDTSSDHDVSGPAAPPGLRKIPRKLPLRRDFEFVRRSESAASNGIHGSLASGPSSSIASTSSAGGLGGAIQQWQVNALVDSLSNDEEAGDVESALRRLEGQINPQKVQENASKVDGWVRTIQERMATGDYSNDEPRSDEDDEAEEQSPESDPEPEDPVDVSENLPSLSSSISQPEVACLDPIETVHTPLATQTSHNIFVPTSPIRGSEPNAIPEDVAPVEVLQSMVSSRSSVVEARKQSLSAKFSNPEVPRTHRSFILGYRAETLVEHFSMIDRELFIGVKFEELFLDHGTSSEDVDVLDWTQFLKDRARWKSESRCLHKTSALAAVRGRFNLISNFTRSEVVLTQPSDRALVVGKFIRIAWKAYSMSNFNTLVAIIAGLQNELVNKAMHRLWNRVGMWEIRMLNDLKVYTSHSDDFLHIRRTVDAIADAKPLDVSSRAASVVSTSGTDAKGKVHLEAKLPIPPACIPFIGIYLSQLRRHGQLPDLIDPTAPNEAVGIDPITSNFDAPAHPEVFSSLTPLPTSMQLEPLINVHKQRLIASVIKSLVAGQHLASRVDYPVDKRVFHKCLKLRALDTDTLRRALSMYPD